MIRPNRAFIIGLAAARISRNTASRLIRMTSSNSSSFMRMRRLSRVTPALLMRMSSLPPSASTAEGTSWSTAVPSDRLHPIATWSPPSSSRKRSSFSTLLPETASRAPCRASALAIALPSPPEAPVTSAVMPLRLNILPSFNLVHAETRRRGGDVIIHDTFQSFLKCRARKIDEQANRLIGEPQISLQLLHMSLVESLDGLDFNQEAVIHQ